ncbi:MAG: tRNA (N(6)-L-threonylcarbamoyladenosine(37)-C(2))-methylthiotransferase MtaB [Prevotella sp.]|jgi:threonylcarbamoyladenosine tRNA methylthiotransferase MtaB|nr:tRNA (N(6)-L-threonylcarbamoyladenosine(37)-C(2))-methylthiotransferase MtaB [Prevotella sp.]
MIDNTIFENKKAAYHTLGCKLNYAETSAIGKQLSQVGVRKTREGEIADICVINTCSVTEFADKKCRQAVRKIIKENPGAFVIVTGCYAQLKPEDVAQIKGVDLVLGSEQKLDVIAYLDELKKKDKGAIYTSETKKIKTFVPSCSQDDRTRYFLKVQDGCDYFCSFCTIPFARGKSRNGTITSMVKQAEEVAAKGGKEIVLTGVNIGDFGKTTGETFFDLVKVLDEVEGIERYRISSIEPNLLTDEIIEFVASSKRFAPHFHIPLQSGSDTVLKLMRRRYDTSLFRQKIEKIKTVMPDAFIGIDVIVGTRGETDELFEETRLFLESLYFSQLHVFTYSERPNTLALKIEHEVDAKTKHARCKALLDISDKKFEAFYQSQQGSARKVLFEHTQHDDSMYGFTENYVKVETTFDIDKANQIKLVTLGSFNKVKTALTEA